MKVRSEISLIWLQYNATELEEMVLTAVFCEDVPSHPSLARPQSLDPGALSLPQPPGQRRVGVGLVVAKLGMVKVRRAAGPTTTTTSCLLALLSSHPVKI